MDELQIVTHAGSRVAEVVGEPETSVILAGSVMDAANWVEVPADIRHLIGGRDRVHVVERVLACVCESNTCVRLHTTHGLMVTECAERGEFLWQRRE